jgi:predicted lipoprotein
MPSRRKLKDSGNPLGLESVENILFSDYERASILKALPLMAGVRSTEEEDQLLTIISDCIGVYRLFKANNDRRAEPRDRRDAILAVHDCAKAFRAALKQLDPSARALLEARAGGGRRRIQANMTPFNESGFEDKQGRGTQRLRLLLRAVELSIQWAGRALKDVPKSQSGPKGNAALAQLVKSLASIYTNETGQKFSRSYKSGAPGFVSTVVAKAEPSATSGQIDEAMKEPIRASSNNLPAR